MKLLKPITTSLVLITLLSACGGGGGGTTTQPPPVVTTNPPSEPINLSINTGSTAVSLKWEAPVSNGGSPIQSYSLQVTPAVASSDIEISNTKALVNNLIDHSAYEFSVVANNAVGASPASTSITTTPKPADTNVYSVLNIANEPGSLSGIYDPSLVQATSGEHWLSYSSVNFYTNNDGDLVQDVGIRLAKSDDGGDTFTYVANIASPFDGTVTDSDPNLSACGSNVCTGRWVYETSWLVEDTNDTDPAHRFKLFAHKYFLYPPRTGSKTLYHLGAMVMWTASSPDGIWSAETPVLGWPLTSPDITPAQDITLLDADLASCILLAEGGITVLNNGLNLVFACPYQDAATNSILQKIVMLRSTNNAASFEYAGTLLTPADAQTGIDYFSAPSLIAAEDTAPVLLVTPVVNGIYAGSMAFAFSDDNLLELFRKSDKAVPLTFVPVLASGHFGGASSYARGTGVNGIFQSDGTIGASIVETKFDIVTTQAMGD